MKTAAKRAAEREPTAAEMERWVDEAVNAGAPALNVGGLGHAINDAVVTLQAQMAAMRGKDWRREDAIVIARAAQYVAKCVDELSRLSAFAQGQPDSRPDQAGAWLAGLTDAQLAQVQAWVTERPGR